MRQTLPVIITRVGKKVSYRSHEKLKNRWKWTEQDLLETTSEKIFLDVRTQEIEAFVVTVSKFCDASNVDRSVQLLEELVDRFLDIGIRTEMFTTQMRIETQEQMIIQRGEVGWMGWIVKNVPSEVLEQHLHNFRRVRFRVVVDEKDLPRQFSQSLVL